MNKFFLTPLINPASPGKLSYSQKTPPPTVTESASTSLLKAAAVASA
jgi:hypothetical protein